VPESYAFQDQVLNRVLSDESKQYRFVYNLDSSGITLPINPRQTVRTPKSSCMPFNYQRDRDMRICKRATRLFSVLTLIFGVLVTVLPAHFLSAPRGCPHAVYHRAIHRGPCGSLPNLPLVISPARVARFEKFYHDELAMLSTIDFNSLSQEDKVTTSAQKLAYR